MDLRIWGWLLVLSFLIALAACGRAEVQEPVQRDREVYAAVLDHLSSSFGWTEVDIFVGDSTFPGDFDLDTLGGVPEEIRAIPWRLRRRLDRAEGGPLAEVSVPTGATAVKAMTSIDSLFDAGAPAVLIAFTPVAYAKGGREALLYYSFFCGGLCGQGGWIYFKDVGTDWHVVEEVLHWVS